MNWINTAVLLTFLGARLVSAGPITFTETQDGSGSLGGTSFNNALVTIALTSDTSTIFSPSTDIFADIGPATVSVAGIGTAPSPTQSKLSTINLVH